MTLTERHQWILDQISSIVGEHCVGWVFAAEVDFPDAEDPSATRTIRGFDGGLNLATGLARRLAGALDRTSARMLLAEEMAEDEADDPEEEGEGAEH